jgi:threonine efflux protein
MEHVVVLATLAAIHIAWNFGPGPNVVLVAHAAARESRVAGFMAALGLAAGAALWAAAAAIGLGVLSALEWLQQILRLAGAAYLVWLGVQLWLKSGAALPATTSATAPAVATPGWRPFRLGIMANVANPISLVFFTGIFAAVLPPDLPVWVRAAAVLVIAVDALIWYASLALVFSSRPARSGYARARRWVDRIAGALLIAFGVRLAASTR